MFNNKVSVICTIICSLLLISIPGLTWDRAIEAEKADKIEAPMIVSDDAKASGGKFIWMEGKPATGGGGKGWAEFIINLPKAGTYALWGKVLAWDGNSDSLWVTWQPADPNEDAQATQNVQFRWGVTQGNDWHWDRINHWLDAGTFDREWKFNQTGKTTLRLAVREDATMLDVIFITDNLSAEEAEAKPRTPNASDAATPVEVKGKLTSTWAQMKNR
ncbi:TPA: hypothetical protein EYN98_24060 [Candidatus Poribacteria bacterium]|nr:hypothetical protein [Candidatus Poribacteria bacterium]HIC00365.1 hypothetical protein [Candidatus Poribacteria bacterium]